MTRAIPRVQPGLFDEIVVDNFAGGGGASMGMELGLGRAVDIAINHDREAVEMHKVNHPWTQHYCEDVWVVDPVEVCKGRRVGLAWFSPDCKHFSKAKGGKPVSHKVRGLAWVVIKWAIKVRPRIIMLENVEEFQDWGPLVPVCADQFGNHKRDSNGKICLKPCEINKGKTFYLWVSRLEKLGYRVDYRELRACDYGAPTIRKRLFLIARCDGMPIIWPAATHGDPKSENVRSGKLLPWKTAADCIDWSIPCQSIFERKKPLAEATLRRIAKGIMRYVVNSADPFIVTYYGDKAGEFRGQTTNDPLATQTTENRHAVVVPVLTEHANSSSPRCMPYDEPLRTICANIKGGHHALISPHITKYHGESAGSGGNIPFPTITASSFNKRPGGNPPLALIQAFLAKNYTGVVGSDIANPIGTITSVDHHSLVTANLIRNFGSSSGWPIDKPAGTFTSKQKDALITSNLIKFRGTCKDGQEVTQPMPTITGGGLHVGEVRAFLLKYYGCGTEHDLREPIGTVTGKDRFGLVTVKGEQYQIVDIGLRMLSPRELFRAQGFGDEYIINPIFNGKPLTKTAQVRMCGNSVSPHPAAAIVRANVKLSSCSMVA